MSEQEKTVTQETEKKTSQENSSETNARPNEDMKSFGSLKNMLQQIQDGTFKEVIDDWKWIFSYSIRYKKAIFFYLFMGLSGTLLGQVSAIVNIRVVNIITGRRKDQLALLIVLSVGSMLFSLIINNYIRRMSTKISVDIGNDIQADIFDKIVDSDWLKLSQYGNGDIVNRFNRDISTVSENAVSWLSTIILPIVNFIIIFIVIIRMDVFMGIMAVASAPFMALISRVVISKQRMYAYKVRKINSDMMDFEVETFYNMDTIKSFGIANKYSSKLRWWQKNYRKLLLDFNWFQIKTDIYLSVVGYAISTVCLFYCLYLFWGNKIQYGEMSYLITYRQTLTTSFSTIVALIPNFMTAAVSANRVRELVELPKEVHIPQSNELDKYADDGFTVQMTDVDFSYIENHKVISSSDFLAQPGEIVALVGPSGEGKTTMIRLLLGLTRPQDGHTFVKASNGRQIDMNVETRHLFSYVPQGNTILSGTIAENLRMVKDDATDEEITEALKLACAWDFIEKLPNGIHSKIGERGKGFSEGQAQRISIARAILRNSPILLLDEATSALDVATERQVLRNIIQQRPNKTIIVTTHRPSVLNMCQRVYRVMQTQVTELSEEESARMAMDF